MCNVCVSVSCSCAWRDCREYAHERWGMWCVETWLETCRHQDDGWCCSPEHRVTAAIIYSLHPHTFSTRGLKLMNTWFLPTLHFYAVSFSQLPVGFADNVILNIAIFLSLVLVIRQFLPDVHIQEIKFSFRHQRLILRRSSVTISRQAAGLTRAQWGTRRKKWHSAAFTSVPSKQCNGTIADMQVLFDNVHNRERYLLTMWLYVNVGSTWHWVIASLRQLSVKPLISNNF